MVKMGMQNEQEWAKAQTITVSIDLIEAAKKQLKFLAAVDRNRFLYDGHALQRAIYRYNAFWLPLLAKHSENSVPEEPLVVPLDCEWIWHCHRLNPIRYKIDCEKLFGRILGNHNIISSVECPSNIATKKIWNELYPDEPYELDLNRPFSEDLQKKSQNEKFTSYDLIAAVKRQSPFFFQISRPHVMDELFLKEAAARYKGFLHLVRINRKMSLKRLCVPTYDIDLMWHTHQLYPDLYCKDMCGLVGSVVQHDDTVSDRVKGGKLDNGQFQTTRQWEDTFGFSYWRAGANYRGTSPSPVTEVPYKFNVEGDELNTIEKFDQELLCPIVKTTEILLEFVDIKNVPVERKGNLVVLFSKKNPDKLLNTKKYLGISSNYTDKQVALLQCEPKGEFLFELMSRSSPNEPLPKSLELLGSCSLSLEEMMSCRSQLATKKWVSVDLVSGLENSKPVLLCVSISFTPPTPAPQLFQLVHTGVQTHVLNYDKKKVFTLQTRNVVMEAQNCTSPFEKEVYCVTNSGEKHTLFEFDGNCWSIKGTQGSFKLQVGSGNDEFLFELIGYKMVRLFPGRRLEFESKQNKNLRSEQEFITVVEFSVENPYGKAVALIDKKFETIKATDEWIVLPGIAMAFILASTNRKDGKNSHFSSESQNKVDDLLKDGGNGAGTGGKVEAAALCAGECVDRKYEEIVENGDNNGTSLCISKCGNKVNGGNGTGLCISKCGNMVNAGNGTGLCISKCGNMVNAGNGTGLCISKCGNMVNAGNGTGLCISKCGNIVNAGNGTGLCISKCGNMVNAGNVTGLCISKCGNMVNAGNGIGLCISKCGNMVNAGNVTGLCISKCGNMVNAGNGTGLCISKCGNNMKSYENNGSHGGKVEAAALCAGECVDMVENGINGTDPCTVPSLPPPYFNEDGAGFLDMPMQASGVSNNIYVKCDDDAAVGVLNMSDVVYAN